MSDVRTMSEQYTRRDSPPRANSAFTRVLDESNAPFYRVTYLSNYSPEVVPDASRQHSLLAEISHSEFKPEDRASIVDRTIEGMLNTRLLDVYAERDGRALSRGARWRCGFWIMRG